MSDPNASLCALDSWTMCCYALLRDSCISVCLFGVTNLIPGTWKLKGGEKEGGLLSTPHW